MEGIFKKVLNPSSLRRADKKALTLYFIRECSMSSEIWKVSRIPVSGNKVLLSPALPSMSIRQTRRGPLKLDRKEPSNISLKFYREYSCRLSCATRSLRNKARLFPFEQSIFQPISIAWIRSPLLISRLSLCTRDRQGANNIAPAAIFSFRVASKAERSAMVEWGTGVRC